MEDVGLEGRIILKWIFKKWDGGTMDWIDPAGDGDKWRTVVNAVMNLHHHYYHHRVLLLLMEHGASMKSFEALRSPAIPLTSLHDLPVFLISSSVVLRHVLFGLPLLLYS